MSVTAIGQKPPDAMARRCDRREEAQLSLRLPVIAYTAAAICANFRPDLISEIRPGFTSKSAAIRFKKSPSRMRFLMIGTSAGLMRYEGARRLPLGFMPVIYHLLLIDRLTSCRLDGTPRIRFGACIEVISSGSATATDFADPASIKTARRSTRRAVSHFESV